MKSFKNYICLKEGKENIDQPHIISADPPIKLPKGIEKLGEAFKKSKEVALGKEVDPKSGGEKNVTMKSKKLFLVGEAVRDYLLNHTPHEFELVTDAHPEEVEKICKNAHISVLNKNVEKGITTVSSSGEKYEIETMKLPTDKEGKIHFTTTPEEDVKRRDMTANSLYYEISTNKIYDFTGGLRHIKDGTARFIGNPKDQLSSNGLNKFKYVRTLHKIGGKVTDDIKSAITSHDGDVPPDQVRDEFWKGLEDLHSNVEKYLRTYHELDLLKFVFPNLEISMDFPNCPTCKTKAIVLASLLKNNSPPKLVKELQKLRYKDREIKDAVFLLNLLLFKPEYIYDFKTEILKTSLTKRQILDWAKLNKLDTNLIEKMVDHKLSVNHADVSEKEQLIGHDLHDRVRSLEKYNFMKSF